MPKIIIGTFIHSTSLTNIQVLRGVMLISDDGILSFLTHDEYNKNVTEYKKTNPQIFTMKEEEFMIPGFIDTHTHAPQYVNAGRGTDLPLLDWLKKYTFPTETKFQDEIFAEQAYTTTVKRFIKNGTTTCAYYGTIHLEASLILSRIVKQLGQRGFIGKVCMDRNAPDTYIEKTEESLEKTESFIQQVLKESENGLTTPIITPRFAPTCTIELMKGLSGLSEKYKIPIQTHLSENKAEIAWVKDLHPDIPTYTHVYDECGLVTERTIFGHAQFLTQEELGLLKKKGSAISHCPLSNFTLGSGCLDIRRVLKNKVKVGLGTDCSGGYSTSMLSSIRNSIISSHCVQFQQRDNPDIDVEVKSILQGTAKFVVEESLPLNYYESFYLATMGGAESLGLKDKIGNFEKGKEFDALLISMDVEGSPVDTFHIGKYSDEDYLDMFQRFLLNGDDRNITHVYVRGRRLK